MHTPGILKPKSWPPLQVSDSIEQIDSVRRKKILKSNHTQRGTVCQLTIISERFLVDLPMPTGENNKVTHVVHSLMIMQVGKFPTSVNSLQKRWKHFKANIE